MENCLPPVLVKAYEVHCLAAVVGLTRVEPNLNPKKSLIRAWDRGAFMRRIQSNLLLTSDRAFQDERR
jgi:hypothetical protein